MLDPDYPDEDLPLVQMSLRQFCARAKTLYEAGIHDLHEVPDFADVQTMLPFIRLVLGGRIGEEEDQRRIVLNPRQDNSPAEEDQFTLRRDYDSIIGVSRTLPFASAFSVYIVPDFSYSMTRRNWNHLTYPMRISGETRNIGLYRIPNMILGRADKLRQQTLVFFPGLFDPANTHPELNKSQLSKFYDQCILAAVNAVCPDRVAYWPTTYEHATRKSRDDRGRMHFATEYITEVELPEFTQVLIAAAVQVGLGDIFFVHELRGVKNATFHDNVNEVRRDWAWDGCMDFLDQAKINTNDPSQKERWYVDVAVEVAREGGLHVLQWLSTCQEEQLKIGLPNATEDEIRRLARSKTMVKVDTSAQVYDLAGMRVTTGKAGHRDKVVYINMYTTEKNGTYTPNHTGAYARHHTKDLFPGAMKKLLKDTDTLSTTFRDFAGVQDDSGHWLDVQSGAIRYEVRVELREGQQALEDLTVEHILPLFVSIRAPIWWTFKYWRCKALEWVFQNLHRSSEAERMWRESLQLGAISVYMLNALTYRPGEQSWDSELVIKCAAHALPEDLDINDEEELQREPMLEGRGAYFLADVWLNGGKTVRMPAGRVLDKVSLCRVYFVTNWPDLAGRFNQLTFQQGGGDETIIRPRRMGKWTSAEQVLEIQPEVGQVEPQTKLNIRFKLRPWQRVKGADVELHRFDSDNDDDYDPENTLLGTGDDLDRELLLMFYQLCVDLMHVSPNERRGSQEAWTTLTRLERDQVTPKMLQGTLIPFRRCVLKPATVTLWGNNFDRICPPPGDPPRTVPGQRCNGWKRSIFRVAWIRVMNRLPSPHAQIVRRSFQQVYFNTLTWVPVTKKERIWSSGNPKNMGNNLIFLPPRKAGETPGVHLLVNPNIKTPVIRTFQLLHVGRIIGDDGEPAESGVAEDDDDDEEVDRVLSGTSGGRRARESDDEDERPAQRFRQEEEESSGAE